MVSKFEPELQRNECRSDGHAHHWLDILEGPTPDPVADRIAEVERYRHLRLLKRAQALELQVEPDYVSDLNMVVWSPSERGRCEVVSRTGCSCREFRLWGNCPHYALYRYRFA